MNRKSVDNMKPESARGVVRKVTYGGILSAVILLATLAAIPMPSIKGYINFGDGVIMAAAIIMGPYAAVSAAVGSALADILSSYVIFAPATFVIKGLMGLFAGLVFKKYTNIKAISAAGVFTVCELIMISGYFLFETFYYALTYSPLDLSKGAMTAVLALPFNAIQAVAAIVISLAIMPIAKRIRIDSPDRGINNI